MNEALIQSDPSQHPILSPNDTFAKVFKNKNHGCVHGLGMGVCPSNMFGTSSQTIHLINGSSVNLLRQKEVEGLRTKVAETKEQVCAILEHMKDIGGSIPPYIFNQKTTNQQVQFEDFTYNTTLP